ncbi:hypothetical protein [Flavobacterium sp. IMCC34518]|uniref:hypothetical protein n=1 Tax=Flavobacterium sp. IMCC34518 TaxID=3003623 RepID=UPI0022AC5004|nr:hypothetical protein [Flavobacterium sp. IMCC34518]
MEFNKIEVLLEKYFEGETSIAEETELKNYFSSANVATHLEQYKAIFGYFEVSKAQKLTKKPLFVSRKRKINWLAIAASIVVLLGIGTYTYNNMHIAKESKELGTYDNPEEALQATQKALAMLSTHVNVGVESIQYIKVYEVTKEKVFVE